MPLPAAASRDRLLAAMRNQVPDRVPVAPDISMYVPLRFSGCTRQDFWLGGDCGRRSAEWPASLTVRARSATAPERLGRGAVPGRELA